MLYYLFITVSLILSVVYFVLSYSFVDSALMAVVAQTKPKLVEVLSTLNTKTSLNFANGMALALVLTLFATSILVIFYKKEITSKMMLASLAIPSILTFSYPVLSRDIFSYLIYAKMAIIYHQNPYLTTPLANAGSDLWLGFTHNVERVYAYGPIALLINIVPMLLIGAEKFIINFYALKTIYLLFFLFGAWLWMEISNNKKAVLLLWILNPFVLNELIINNHNDLMMIVFFWNAIYLFKKGKALYATLFYSISVGVKFLTAPLLPVLFLPKKMQEIISWFLIIFISNYILKNGNLTWYFSWIYFCMPYLKLNKAQILTVLILQLSLVLGYAGFLETGSWDQVSRTELLSQVSNLKKYFLPVFVLVSVLPYLNLKNYFKAKSSFL
jgi:hypothetical protein